MASLLKVSEEELRGQSLWRFLTDPDAARLRERIASGPEASAERVMLNFVPAEHMPYSLQCTLQILARGIAVVGNDFVQDERALQRELGEHAATDQNPSTRSLVKVPSASSLAVRDFAQIRNCGGKSGRTDSRRMPARLGAGKYFPLKGPRV